MTMNRIAIVILFILLFQACKHENVLVEKPTIDERVELMSIVFRLAERWEYSNTRFELYNDKIEQHFEKYKSHELILFTKSIIKENGIAFDGPMCMAMHLDNNLNLLTDVKDVWQLDPTWTKENVEKFVPLLQKFYNDTRFDEFYKNNADLYAEAVKRFSPIYEQVDLKWLYSFFGKEPREQFFIKIGLGIWGKCYGVNVDYNNGNRNIYAIMGAWQTDNSGFPEFSKSWDLPILIHEFSHPFVDKLTVTHKKTFQKSGEKMYSVIKDVIGTEAYPSWEVVLDEALVNAITIKYMKDHDYKQAEIESFIKSIKDAFGFFWLEELTDELESYEKQRDKYPTLESYMPKLGEAYISWTENILTNTQQNEREIASK